MPTVFVRPVVRGEEHNERLDGLQKVEVLFTVVFFQVRPL